ncbi:MAG TPA: DNA repair protein RadC [Sedimentibacter sp.]|jgi:DNA repair protein RadC|nr:DNA repair protein RadC [Sedimentibacter sp.]HHY99575.1 DNA repair protein RadC [Tissierellia bacterium]HOK49590.1 DNA repair protein RadC [Sedimentibacter sp.]HOW23338.1 DNA repair protein RadC [Sedimentibacter sp.]HRC80807.1 DNA repair protein RadC [Sedimentibacter sp.]
MENNNYTIKSIPADDRPQEKLLKYGANTLSNSELIAVILRTGTKEENVVRLAQRILKEDGKGLRNIAEGTIEKFKSYKGINDVKASKLMALAEISKRMSSLKIEKIKISSPDDAAVIMMEEMRYYQKEYFKIILLDTKNNVKKISEISVGSLSSSIVHPREVFYEAVVNLASSIILVHNHPSGECEPSNEDIVLTNRLDECGKILGIKILDHIIIGDGVYFSFKEEGLL